MHWILAALTLAALALRLPGYLVWWFNPDEAIYLQVATREAEQAWAMVAGNAHPPLYYALLRGLARASAAAAWLRLPSLLAGVALVPLLFVLTRRLADVRVALFAAALACCVPNAIPLGQVMRPYALQCAALALALIGLLGYLRSHSRSGLALYGLSLTLALGLHYSSFIALGGIGLTLLALALSGRLARRELLELAAAHVLPLVLVVYLYLHHVSTELQGSGLQADARDGWLQSQFVQDPAQAGRQFMLLLGGLFGGARKLALGFALLGLWSALRAGRRELWLLPLATLATALTLSALGLYPLGGSRHSAYQVVFLLPLVAAGGVTLFTDRRRWIALPAALLGLVLLGAAARSGLRLTQGEAQGGVLPEGVVLREEALEVERCLNTEVPAEAIVLADGQTLQLLLALYGSPQSRFRRQGNSGLSQCTLGERTFLFLPQYDDARKAPAWMLLWRREDGHSEQHLRRVLDLLEQRPLLWQRVEQHGLWVVQGGWGANLAHGEAYRVVSTPTVIERAAGGLGLGVFRLDLPAYRAYLAGK